MALFEIDIESLTNAMSASGRSYKSTSRFPQSHRDLALIVDQDVSSARVQAIIKANALVVGSTPFDVYSGEGVAEGKKSVAYAVTFQSAEGTLTSEEVDQAQDSILRRLEREVGATLRR